MSAARQYAGPKATNADIQAYLDGWSRWSDGALKSDTIIRFSVNDELLQFAKAEFAHEAAAETPLTGSGPKLLMADGQSMSALPQ